MKITPKDGLCNAEKSAGIVNIKGWEGTEMIINIEYLKTALKVIESLNEIGLGLDMDNFRIGITPPTKELTAGAFFAFLNSNRTVAYSVAGKTEE